MEKKEYVAPEMEIVDVELDDVVLASLENNGILNAFGDGEDF